MKTFVLSTVLFLSILAVESTAQTAQTATAGSDGSQGQPVPPPTAYQIATHGANSRVWQRQEYEKTPDGHIVAHTHSFTECASGMYYQNTQGAWVESQELIEPFANGAVAAQGAYKVIFANNLNSSGAIDLQTPDGKRLQSNILGLRYYDRSTGQAVLIAQTQDSIGQIIAHNQVLFVNAFQGVEADIRYTYKRGSFEQDVILREQLPTAESVGLNSDTTELQVMTEFLSPPQEAITENQDAQGETMDQTISWGAMIIGHGRAFDIGDDLNSSVSVTKEYATIDGRKILLEKVLVDQIQAASQSLPLHASIKSKFPKMAGRQFALPAKPMARVEGKPMRIATAPPDDQGFVLDYVTLGISATNFVFRGDTTYFVNGDVNLALATTIEGGTVIKINTNSSCSINILGTLNCKTAPYRPAVFTSADDSSVGEGISYGSSPPCTGTLDLKVQNDYSEDIQVWVYADTGPNPVDGVTVSAGDTGDFTFTAGLGQHYQFDAFDTDSYEYYSEFWPMYATDTFEIGSDQSLNYSESGSSLCTPPSYTPPVALSLANGGTVHDVRICDVGTGISSLGTDTVYNAQFINCAVAMKTENTTLYAGNILMSQVGTAFLGQDFHVTAENVTFDQGTNLTADPVGTDTNSSVSLANALLTGVANWGVVSVTTNHVLKQASSSGVYQPTGAGNYYLVTNSVYHGTGTASIQPWLLSILSTKTTYPPVVYSNVAILAVTNLSPRVPRDTNAAPDYGYHYDLFDYVFGNVGVATNLTFAAGTAVGWFDSSGNGMHVNPGVHISFNGTATQPCVFAHYATVQEELFPGWVGYSYVWFGIAGIGSETDPAHAAVISPTFTHAYSLGAQHNIFRDYGSVFQIWANNSEFHSGAIGGYGLGLCMTNCLFDQMYMGAQAACCAQIAWRNCTMHGGTLIDSHWGSWPVSITNCVFDGTAFSMDSSHTTCGCNAYVTNDATLPITSTTDVYVTNFNWQAGYFGNYYLPTNSPLIDHGNTNANLLGLYHFTTQTNQVPEGNSKVDIGYHYVATDGSGNPSDSNGDGVPDYLEDANGNGLVDNGETNWAIALYQQPHSQTVPEGSNATFTVTVEGVMPLYYQWYFGTSPISGATNSSLTLTDVQATNVGNYSVIASNAITSTNSASAFLGETVYFNFTNFCDYSALQLNGSAALATPTNANCELELTPSTSDQTGTAFYKFPVSLSSNASFSTFFSFRMNICGGIANQWDNGDGHMGADGITFIVQTLANTNGGNAGGLGYLGISNSAAVEFDTWYNNRTNQPSTGDPDLPPGQTNANGTTGDGNHVAIDLNGVMSNLAVQHIPDDMNNSNIWYAWVDYDGVTNLQVRVSENSVRPVSPTISYQMNMISYLQTSNAYVGFGAGTGGAYEQQDILSWQFVSPYNPIGASNVFVTIVSPTNQIIQERTNLLITAVSTNMSPAFPVNVVQFFCGSNCIGTAFATNNVCQLVWPPALTGNVVLQAYAINTNGITAWSPPVTNYIRSIPTVAISSLVNGEIFAATPTNISLTANAAAYGGATVTGVTYYQGTNVLATITSGSTYAFTWNGVTNGMYILHAKVTDSMGASGISSNIVITVEPTNEPPYVYPGSNQTNYLSNLPFKLNGIVRYYGLPVGDPLVVTWTNLNGGTNVTFTNASLPRTAAYFWATGTYTLNLSVSNSAYQVSSNLTITVLSSNQAPVITAVSNFVVYLPAPSTNSFIYLNEQQITNDIPGATGVDYFALSNCVIASVNVLNNGNPYNFVLVARNGSTNRFSSLSNLTDEVYISAARNAGGGFSDGEMFCGNGIPGQIMRVEPDGSLIGTNEWISKDSGGNPITNLNAWVVLPTFTTNGNTIEPGLLRGGLWLDRTGIWGGDLIVTTTQGSNDASAVGYIWRVNSQGQANLVAQLNSSGDTFEGVTTIPNDPTKYGPWAGKIMVGGDGPGNLFGVDTNGFVVAYNLPFGAEDIRVIPVNENFYGCDQGTSIWGISADQFSSMTGDILIAEEAPHGLTQSQAPNHFGSLYRLHWDGTDFQISQVANKSLSSYAETWEGANFAPAGIASLPQSALQLQSTVTDDGEIRAKTMNQWTVISNAGPVYIADPNLTNSTVEFSQPGNYLLQLSAYDGQYTTTSNVTVQVIQSVPPIVDIKPGTNLFLFSSNHLVLHGEVISNGLPANVTNITWSLISHPSTTSGLTNFSNTNSLTPTAFFDTNSPLTGTYVFLMTVDNGYATNSAEVSVTIQFPLLTISPSISSVTTTNVPYTVTAQLLDATGAPITNTLVNLVGTIAGVTSVNTNIVTDTNGLASITYYNLTGSFQSDSWHAGYSGSTPEIHKYWTQPINCGDSIINRALTLNSSYSIEHPTNPTDYYTFSGTAGVTVSLTMVQLTDVMAMILRDPSGRTVASTTENFTVSGTPNTLNYELTTNGAYILEVVGLNALDKYNLYFNCSDETNYSPQMEVLYQSTNVPSSGTLVFPLTSQSAPTNVTLTVTNAGNAAFEIVGFGTNGDFNIPGNILGTTLAPGAATNLNITFNASASGMNLGSLVLVGTNPNGTNSYIVYLVGNTFPTNAAPTVQLVNPQNGTTILDNQSVTFTALATPGSAPIDPGYVELMQITTNGIFAFLPHRYLYSAVGNYYTNSYRPQDLLPYGDSTLAVVASDANGSTVTSSPNLIHLLPAASNSPTITYGIAILSGGTNLPTGSTVVFPSTVPGIQTNVTLMVTNTGNYPLGINWAQINGDFDLSTNVVGSLIEPSNAITMTLTFNASQGGRSVGELALSNNASVGGMYVLQMVGNAVLPNAIQPSSTNLPPEAFDQEFHVLANSRNNVLYPLTNDIDLNGYPLKIKSIYGVSQGASAVIINNGQAVLYSPPAGYRSTGPDSPADGFYYSITDAGGLTNSATVYVDIDASDIPVVDFTNLPNPYTTNAGAVVPLVAYVSPSRNVAKVDFYQGTRLIGEVTNGVGGFFTTNWTALYGSVYSNQFFAQASDIYGQMSSPATTIINVTAPTGGGQAVAGLNYVVGSSGTNFLNPTNLTTVRDGLFRLYGQAYHSTGSNVVWQLGVYTVDGTLVRDLSPAATGTVGSAATSSNLLTCDLTTLMNGVYFLQLTVSGGYTVATTSMEIDLESNLKVGQFSFSQQDLVIPVNGIPLTVTRTYNSINPNKGDFGYGWTYALNSMSVSLDETRIDTNDIDGDQFSERDGGGWDVTLTLPNGQTTTFTFYLDGPFGLGKYQARWHSAPGVAATLATVQPYYLEAFIGSVEGRSDLYYWDQNPQTPWNAFDFPSFVLTMQDGTRYYLNREDLGQHFMDDHLGDYVQAYGQPYLDHIVERDLDTIKFNPDSVIFQNTNGVIVKQITFTRNANNLITAVYDPNNQGSGGHPDVQYQYDANDNLISVANLVNAGTQTYVTNSFQYTNTFFPHYITGIINANGTQVAQNFYDDTGKLIEVKDADGYTTRFIHNLTNASEVILDRLGYTNTYVYDDRGNVTVQTNQLGQKTTMAYDINNNKTNEVMFLNGVPYATNNYVYNTNLNLMVQSIDPLGNTTIYAYDNNGNLTNSVDANGNGTTNVYDNSGNLVNTFDALGHGITNVYSDGLLVSSIDSIGTTTVNYYDNYENLIASATLDSSGKILSTNTSAYDSNGNRNNSTTWRNTNGVWTAAATVYVYDSMSRVVQTINPDAGTNIVIYNVIGKQQETMDALGKTTSYVYDDQGRLVQTTYADSTTQESAYDANGNRVTSTDQAGRVTAYVYDALNRLVETVYPDGTTNATVYDDVGRVAQTIDAKGTITAFAYDAAGRRLVVTNAVGATAQMISRYAYDPNGNQITFTDANNNTTTNVFDVLNRGIQVQYPDGTTSETLYDAVGRRVASTNQDGIVTWFAYDGSGRLIAVTNAIGQITHYQYDESGNETAQIDALGRTNSFAYDGTGRKVSHTRPDGLFESFSYDLDGNVTNYLDFNNTTMASQYDAMNRLTNRIPSTSDNTRASFTYTATGQRQKVAFANENDVISYSYDSRDRLVQKTLAWGGGVNLISSLNYGYDANGNVTNIASGMANGVHLAYGYDPLNRLTNVLARGQPAASYQYDAVGNRASLCYGNGVTNQYQYDSLNRLTNLVWKYQGAPRASFTYQMKLGGTRTNLSETVNNANRSYAWSYDNIYRLTSEVIGGSAPTGTVGYAYDLVGNRTNRTSNLTGLTPDSYYTYDTNDELTADANAAGTFSYDHNGNTTYYPEAGATYGYDQMNRLVQGTNASTFSYDADGNRIQKYAVGPTYYVVDDRNPSGYPQVLEEYRINTNLGTGPLVLSRVYNYGLDLISQQQFSTNTMLPTVISYYGYDGHDSVRFLMDTNGAITDTYIYDAYGTVISSWATNTIPTPNNYLYCGQQNDPDLGMYYNRARYLNTDSGRFWSSDSTEGNSVDPFSLHKYLFAQDNPTDGSDPTGHFDVDLDLNFDGLLNSLNFATVSSVLNTIALPTKTFYFSVDTQNCPAHFDSVKVEKMLQDQLSANVFNNLADRPTVKVTVREEAQAGFQGWVVNKSIYINRVEFGWGNVPYGKFAENDHQGGIAINLNPIVGQPVPVQGWVNYFAHEGIWGNVAVSSDDNSQPEGDISCGSQNYNPFTVAPASRLTILKACDLRSN